MRAYGQLDWASPDDVSQFLESRNVDETVCFVGRSDEDSRG